MSTGRPERFDVVYGLMALFAIALIPLGPFTGLPLIRMAPTLLLAWVTWRRTRSVFGITIGLGLFFGAWGDFFLNLFRADLAPLGMLGFFLGHIAYIAGMRRSGWASTPGRRAAVVGLIVFGVSYAALIAWFNPQQEVSSIAGIALTPAPQLLPVTPALLPYLPALIAMASVALLRRGSWLVPAGALVFVSSDALIPVNLFLLPKAAGSLYASDALMFVGFGTYYLAQYLMARGAADEVRLAKQAMGT